MSFSNLLLSNNSVIVVHFLLGNSPVSEVYMPTFCNTLSHLHRQVDVKNDRLRMLGYSYRKRFGSGYFRAKPFPV